MQWDRIQRGKQRRILRGTADLIQMSLLTPGAEQSENIMTKMKKKLAENARIEEPVNDLTKFLRDHRGEREEPIIEARTSSISPESHNAMESPGIPKLIPVNIIGIKKLSDESFEYAIECRKNGEEVMLVLNSKDFKKGVPGLIIDYFEKNMILEEPPAIQEKSTFPTSIQKMGNFSNSIV